MVFNMQNKKGIRIHVLALMLSVVMICSLLLPLPCDAQVNTFKFSHLTVQNGLSQNWVRCVYQDSYGYLWFGTDNGGINKFDGYNFTLYEHNSAIEDGISSNTINLIMESNDKKLWIGTRRGLNVYDREKDKFTHYPLLQEEFIIGLHIFENGKIIVVTSESVFLLDPKNKSIRSLCSDKEGPCIRDDFLTSVVKDNNGNLWVGSAEGLWLIDTISSTMTQFDHDKNNSQSICGNIVTSLYCDHDGRIWAGTRYNGISIMKPYKNNNDEPEFIHIKHDPFDLNSISEGQIRVILHDTEGNIWIGTENGGINVLRSRNYISNNFIFEKYTHNLNDNTSISSNSIYAMYEDNQHTMWVGTFNGGLSYYNKLLYKFDHYKPISENPNSLNDNFINTFFEEGNDLWIGTENGLNILNRKTNTFKFYTHNSKDKRSIGSNAIWSILKDRNNNIWVGTWDGGLNLFNRSTGTFTRYLHSDTDTNSILSNNVFGIIEDRDGDLWIACMDGGLSRFNYKSNTFTSYRHVRDGDRLSGTWVRTLLEDSYGLIWISVTNAVQVYDKTKDTFTTYRNIKSDSTSISYDGAVVFFEDSKKNLWIGTEGGLNLFHRDKGIFSCYRVKDGLPNNVIKGICEDDRGNLWISTNKGISKFVNGILAPHKPEFINYDVHDGLQGDEFNRRSFYKDKEGKLYFGGTNGFNVFDPKSIEINPYKPKVVFTNFLLFNKPVRIGSVDKALPKHISMCREIKLDYKSSVFTIQYAALNYLVPEKNEYAYRLLGFEEEWNYVGNIRSANYTNLDPGKYTFQVKASNNNGIWNEVPASIKIVIVPPWWMTWWFRIIAVLLVIISLIAFYLYRINQVKKRNRELEMAVKERTKEVQEKNAILVKQTTELNETNTLLEEGQQKIELQAEELLTQNEKIQEAFDQVAELNRMKDKFFSIIGHDLKNPINTIMGFSELLKNKIDNINIQRRNKYINSINESSKTTFILLENLLHWARSQSGRYQFKPISIQIEHLVKSIIILLKEQYTEKEITIDIDIDNDCKVYCDTNMTETVLRNILSNAIKFTHKGGKVKVRGNKKTHKGYVTISVADTGVGIPEEKINGLFRIDSSYSTPGTSGESGTGLGLILCYEFVTKNGGKIWVESKLNKGTTFYFTLPNA